MPSRRVRHLMFSSKALGASASYFAPAITGLSDGDAVGTWSDLSGNGNDATASGTARPTFKVAVQGGQPEVNFDGSNDIMSLNSSISVGNPSTFTVITVIKYPSDSSKFWAICNYSNQTPYAGVFYGTNTLVASNAKYGYAAESSKAFNVWSDVCSSGTLSKYKNGVAKSLATANLSGGSSFDSFGSVTGEYGKGASCAIVCFNLVLGTSLRLRVETSLGYTFRIAQSGS